MPTVYSYLRFSSAEQSKGDSHRRQTALRERWLKANKLAVDEVLTIEDLGLSGWQGKNAAVGNLAAFVEAIRKGLVRKGSILVVEHLDRLSRNYVRKAVSLFSEILDAGVTIQTLEPERTYRPEDNDALTLIEPVLLFAQANAHSEKLSDRLKSAWKAKRDSGKPLTSWCPSWLRLSDAGAYELIPEAAATVRQIILDLSVKRDFGGQQATKWLNVNKVPVISRTGRAKGWTYAYVAKIYKSLSLIGHYTPGIDHDGQKGPIGEVRENYFPAVLTHDEWYSHRSACDNRRKLHGRPTIDKDGTANLFSGLLVNPRDGLKYARIVKNHPRLISQAFRNGIGDTQSFPYQPVEVCVLLALAERIKLADVLGNAPSVVEDRTPLIEAELTETLAKIEQTKERIAKRPDVDAFFDLLADLDGKRKRLTEELEAAKAAQANKGGEAVALADLKQMIGIRASIDAVKEAYASDDEDLRPKIRAKLRQLVSEMRMVVYGVKKSKFKTAEVQIYFKAGGACSVTIADDTLVGGIDRVYDYSDFRRWDSPEVQAHVARTEALWAAAATSKLKYPKKPAKV